ncbi:MAG: hypothetical protein ACFFG0_56985 [Candidatus Thorarchaeota archaeon]
MEDCFDKIIKASCNSEVTKYKVMIELMKDLEEGTSNALRVRNCLLFLINLCFIEKSADHLDNIGKNVKELSKTERTQMKELLKYEIIH